MKAGALDPLILLVMHTSDIRIKRAGMQALSFFCRQSSEPNLVKDAIVSLAEVIKNKDYGPEMIIEAIRVLSHLSSDFSLSICNLLQMEANL